MQILLFTFRWDRDVHNKWKRIRGPCLHQTRHLLHSHNRYDIFSDNILQPNRSQCRNNIRCLLLLLCNSCNSTQWKREKHRLKPIQQKRGKGNLPTFPHAFLQYVRNVKRPQRWHRPPDSVRDLKNQVLQDCTERN